MVAALLIQIPSVGRAVCASSATAAAGSASIQSAVDAAGPILAAGDHCVTVEAGTYAESVSIGGIDVNGFRIIVSAAPGAAATVRPPAAAAAGFFIANANVSLNGLRIEASAPSQYALLLSAASGCAFSDVAASNSAGTAVYLDGASNNSFTACALAGGGTGLDGAAGGHALRVRAGSGNVFARSVLTGGVGGLGADGGAGARLEAVSDRNAFSLSTLRGGTAGKRPSGANNFGGHGLYIGGGSNNSADSCFLIGGLGGRCAGGGGSSGGHGLFVDGGASNAVARSTVTGGDGGYGGAVFGGPGGYGAQLSGGSGARISDSALAGGAGGDGPVGGLGGDGLADSGSALTLERGRLQGGRGGAGEFFTRSGGRGLALVGGGSNLVSDSGMAGGAGGRGLSTAAAGGYGGHGLLVSSSRDNSLSRCAMTAGAGGIGGGSLGPGAPGAAINLDSDPLSLSAAALRASAENSTGIQFSGGRQSWSFTGVDFPDANVAISVDASRLDPGAAVSMVDATGSRAGPAYERDPYGVVDWINPSAPPGRPGRPVGTAAAWSIDWTWSAAAYAASYKVYNASNLAPLGTVTEPAYRQFGLSSGTVYGVVVQAFNSHGSSPLSESGTARTQAAPGQSSGDPPDTVDGIRIFPNPLRPALGQTAMRFQNLPAGARLRIYALSGELVRDLSAEAGGTAVWDGTDKAGNRAASGVYFIYAQGNGTKKTVRAAVQR